MKPLRLHVKIILFSTLILLTNCNDHSEKKPNTEVKKAAHYAGSKNCQSCHNKEYNDWLKSDHYLSMSQANDSTVLGDFDQTTFKANGVSNRFFLRDGKYFINTQGDDGKNHDYEILYTFGYYPLQQYLVAFPNGRLQSTRASWDVREKKWFHQYPDQNIYHKDWLHWTGNSQNWNTMCASCHSTNVQKNYRFDQDTYTTTWSEINVGCESCHGPGSEHIESMTTQGKKNQVKLKNSGFIYARNPNPQLEINTCAPCHALKSDISSELAHSDEIMDNLIPQIISDEFYFSDGQINTEAYEYGSFMQSKMFHSNVRCSNCHNPHSGKLVKSGNDLCLTCHKPSYNTEQHHFHKMNTEGAQCKNCHMREKTYMGNDRRRDHSFRIPRPDQSVVYGTPNTCTSCHKSKSNEWAAEAIKKRKGPIRAYHFSDDLLPGSKHTAKSEQHLIKLLNDTLQPEIARATAAFYLGNSQSSKSSTALINALKDKKAMVRYQAARALEDYSPEVWQSMAYPLLSDPVRAVRIAAANLYHRLPPQAIPSDARNAFSIADAENRKYLQYQTDFAVGNVMLADFELRGGDHINAIIHYVRGLKKDSLMNYARLNLASAYNAVHKNQDALKTLNEAALIDSKNERIHYNLGLLNYELGAMDVAVKNFQQAIRLGSNNPSLYYNYGLLLQELGNSKESEQILLRGFSIDPEAANINYALAFLYMNNNLKHKAKSHADILIKIDPNNPAYQELFRSLGM